MKNYWLSLMMALFAIIGVACSNSESMEDHDMSKMNESEKAQHTKDTDSKGTTTKETEMKTGNEFTITAKEAIHTFNKDTSLPVWTYDGSVPGSQIRVKQGEQLKINLKNELSEPVTIHWHGLPVPNNQDGIPGVTMNAVQPGKTFTYEFTAAVPGTYWYHSHQESVNQIDKGLYGTLIVEENQEKADRDYTLVLDEWISNPEMANMEMGNENMEGMDHSGMDMGESEGDMKDMHSSGMNMESHDMSMYDLYTINGKSGESVSPLTVKKGETVKLRLVNAGYMSHKIHLHGHKFKVTSSDGQPIENPDELEDSLVEIAPGERYDLEFTADSPGTWLIESHDESNAAKGMKAEIVYEGTDDKKDQTRETEQLPVLDITKYGKNQSSSVKNQYDVEYTMDLGTSMGKEGMVYTINDKVYPETEPLDVKKGDLVKVTLKNTSKSDDHPMHLHGHFFQVLSKNGNPVEGSTIMKDTLNIKPGEEYVVSFKADNPGNWMFHCHDLHHASAGMVTEVKYKDFISDFVPDPNVNNQPE
ncbi:FtsP/CotA-like multicopper oxidase with cupredoxin domain [Bacillus ectoiniformans]|uniref:multicopper oxidase family protein n=1 Tax=Bacillus ectoiniformans TaxID=1494429 RepID=UPI00195C94FB|nr:multicopper oxidase family protein [Bacillus ectoiniformans]MBM7647844.1 FtsP/CotA-like multicopper oxidase with cupredoxin domain [Bacillus ectoiniformans]